AMYSGSDVSDFSSMPTVKGIVISDPTTGNVSSSQILVSDGSKGIVLYNHDGYDTFSYKLGDEIEITLDGANLTVYKGQPELVVAAANLKVLASDKMLEPVAITPEQLVSGDYNCMYIKVSGVQVKAAFKGSAWSVGSAGFESESNSNFVVFTRTDATFKEELIPEGLGDLIGIYVYYDGTNEVILNSVAGAAGLTGERFIPEIPGGDPIPVDPVNSSELAYATCGEVPAIAGKVQIQTPVSETYGDGYAYSAKLIDNANQTYVVHTTGTGPSTLRSYSFLYDKTKRAALWVAYVMQNDGYPDNDAGRSDAWTYDPALLAADQANLTNSYSAVNGVSYDRGHQLASNSRQVSKAQNQQTFYYTNMTPQVSTLNQGTWGTLEQKEQGWDNIVSSDTLFVVTGPIFGDNPATTTDASGNACALPTGYYKVIVKASFTTPGNCNYVQGVGFYFPTTGWSDWSASTVSIDEIEEKTGLDFFANLPSEYTIDAEKNTSYSFLE
ncbi:MAG: DNA/RNA non-specific endonuclease, partial [Bacteroidaceae bacterium]